MHFFLLVLLHLLSKTISLVAPDAYSIALPLVDIAYYPQKPADMIYTGMTIDDIHRLRPELGFGKLIDTHPKSDSTAPSIVRVWVFDLSKLTGYPADMQCKFLPSGKWWRSEILERNITQPMHTYSKMRDTFIHNLGQVPEEFRKDDSTYRAVRWKTDTSTCLIELREKTIHLLYSRSTK